MPITTFSQVNTLNEQQHIVKQAQKSWANKGFTKTHWITDGDTVISVVSDGLHSCDMGELMNSYNQTKRLNTLKERLKKKLQQKHK